MMGSGMRFRAMVTAVGMLFLAVTVNAMADTKVNSVRLWRAPDNTRLVFDLSGPVQHSVFTLTAPDRLVIDINGASLGAPDNYEPRQDYLLTWNPEQAIVFGREAG